MSIISLKNIASKVNIDEKYLEYYGNDKAKVNLDILNNKIRKGKLILVTSTSPTPYGEGKTTMSIGLHDAMSRIGLNSLAVLREPSMGPVFGIKGGATGGGKASLVPADDINLHFTGDFHAITSANNLIASAIDNHIYFGNKLGIDRIVFRRCLDLNDRALRNIIVNKGNKHERVESFSITAASEVMAVFCVASDFDDLRERIGKMIAGYKLDKPIYVKELNIVGSVMALMKDAVKPNLVRTLEDNPVLIHGGPFANIAHGCNSLIATDMALKLADYVITEAGFGSDLGGFKFFDIKCRIGNLSPDVVLLNTTIRSLKYNGNGCLEIGISNLDYHIINVAKFSSNLIVVINKFVDDSLEDVEFVREFVTKKGYKAIVSTSYIDGGNGSVDLALEVEDVINNYPNKISYLYDLKDELLFKIDKVCKEVFGAKEVVYSDKAKVNITKIEELAIYDLMVCVSKTQYSISGDKDTLGFPKGFTVNITDINLSMGALFVIVYIGDVIDMPGLSKKPSFERIDVVNQRIEGII